MADQMVSTVWNTASHPGHNLQKNLCELTSVFTLLCRSCNSIRKLQVERETAVEDSISTAKLHYAYQSSTKKGAYSKGHKAQNKRTFMTHLSRLTLFSILNVYIFRNL